MTSHRARRYRSPPPEIVVDGLHQGQRLFGALLYAFEYVSGDMSPLHRIVSAQLLVLITVTEFVQSLQNDPFLSMTLKLIKLGLVADRISAVAVRLRRSSSSHHSLKYLCAKIPLVTGLSTELGITVLALRGRSSSTVQRFLTGSVYVKLLAVGGLCLALSKSRFRFQRVSQFYTGRSSSAWILGASGVFMLASPPSIKCKSYH
jgi:Ca2+/H+ antiporter